MQKIALVCCPGVCILIEHAVKPLSKNRYLTILLSITIIIKYNSDFTVIFWFMVYTKVSNLLRYFLYKGRYTSERLNIDRNYVICWSGFWPIRFMQTKKKKKPRSRPWVYKRHSPYMILWCNIERTRSNFFKHWPLHTLYKDSIMRLGMWSCCKTTHITPIIIIVSTMSDTLSCNCSKFILSLSWRFISI